MIFHHAATLISDCCQVPVRTGYDLQIGWDLVTELILVLILWSLAVMNTELLISWNHFDQSDDIQSPWQFGQVFIR